MKVVIAMSKAREASDGRWLPTGLECILDTYRDANRTMGISGIIACRNGRYLHIIEGESEAVDQLLNDIHGDPSHHQLMPVCTLDVAQRYFTGWKLKLIPFSEVDTDFVRLMTEHVIDKIAMSVEQQRQLTQFYNLQHSEHKSRLVPIQTGFEYRLKRWPRMLDSNPDSGLIGLCGLLTGSQWTDCETMLDQTDINDEQELHTLLRSLNGLQLLECRAQPREHREQRAALAKEQSARKSRSRPGGFYQRMKLFLQSRRVSY